MKMVEVRESILLVILLAGVVKGRQLSSGSDASSQEERKNWWTGEEQRLRSLCDKEECKVEVSKLLKEKFELEEGWMKEIASSPRKTSFENHKIPTSGPSYCHDIAAESEEQYFLSSVMQPHYMGRVYTYWSGYQAWYTDTFKNNDSVWQMTRDGEAIIQFDSVCHCARNERQEVEIIELPPSYACFGIESVVRNEKLFCNRVARDTVFVYDLHDREIGHAMVFPDAGNYSYQGHSAAYGGYFDIESDELGMWVTYGSIANDSLITITKVDPDTGDKEETWVTDVKKTDVGNAFMAHGVLYTINSRNQYPTYINYVFNTKSGLGKFLDEEEWIWLNNPGTGSVAMLKYNPRFQFLYSTLNAYHMYQFNLHFDKCY